MSNETPSRDRIDKQFHAEISNLGKGMFAVRVNTEGVDRDAEVVVPDGMDATNFMKAGAILWNHNTDLPVARPLTLTRDKGGWISVGEFRDRPEWYTPDKGEWPSEFVRALVETGLVRSASVGLLPKPGGRRYATPGDKSKYGDDVQTVVSKWELLEWSFVPVPANPEAVVEAVGKSGIRPETARKLMGDGFPMPKRKVQIVVPARAKAAPVDVNEIVKKELARARGSLRV